MVNNTRTKLRVNNIITLTKFFYPDQFIDLDVYCNDHHVYCPPVYQLCDTIKCLLSNKYAAKSILYYDITISKLVFLVLSLIFISKSHFQLLYSQNAPAL